MDDDDMYYGYELPDPGAAEYIFQQGREAIWECNDGRLIAVKNMSDRHICNWLAWYARNREVLECDVFDAYEVVIKAEHEHRYGALMKRFCR